MANVGIRLTIKIKDKQIIKLLNTTLFKNAFNKRMSQQFLPVGEFAKRQIQEKIDSNNYAKLGVWQHIKGNDSVLKYTGAMGGGFRFKFHRGGGGALVGIKIQPVGKHGPSGLSMAKIVEIMNNGMTWTPTEAQRRAVAAKARAAGAPAPVGPRKEVWTIPARPFFADAVLNKRVLNKALGAATTAFNQTIKDLIGK